MTNLTMTWIGYQMVYDFVPHFWVLGSLKLHKIGTSMAHWMPRLVANNIYLSTVDTKRDISG